MKKKFITVILCITMLASSLALSGCGNYDVLDTQCEFSNAYIKVGDTWVDVEIKSWRDYDGEQIQIKLKDDTVLLLSSVNCILYDGKLPNKR